MAGYPKIDGIGKPEADKNLITKPYLPCLDYSGNIKIGGYRG